MRPAGGVLSSETETLVVRKRHQNLCFWVHCFHFTGGETGSKKSYFLPQIQCRFRPRQSWVNQRKSSGRGGRRVAGSGASYVAKGDGSLWALRAGSDVI